MSPRSIATAALLLVETGLAVLGASVAYGLTAEYGEIGASRTETFLGSLGVQVIALGLVAGAAAITVAVGRSRAVTAVAVAIPVLMLAGTWLAGPAALQHKLETQYDATPQCEDTEMTTGPGAVAARDAQETFDSIDHVGWFGGGGSSGVGGCERGMELTGRVDVVGHYGSVLEADGWTLTRVDPAGLRAERDGRAVEVARSDGAWTIWTGPVRGGMRPSSGGVAP